MINLKALQVQVRHLESDLRERGPKDAKLGQEWRDAREAQRTAAPFESWLNERITQVAVAWVLGTVFVRFCEDNGLIELPVIAGPGDRTALARDLQRDFFQRHPEKTDRDWIAEGFKAMSVSPVAAGLFEQHNPMWTILPSHDAAKALLDFWRSTGPDGEILYDFTDPEWNTRFLGDLYQDLSEAARKTYALLQTPEFVEEFILNYTLDPAIEEFGLEPAPPYGHDDLPHLLRVIDPACGSGHFLLGAFGRLLHAWQDQPGDTDKWTLISRALQSVHGVDKNPFAVAIARFRLMLAAMKAGDVKQLSAQVDFPVNVAVGDSLLHGYKTAGQQRSFDQIEEETHVFTYRTEDINDYVKSVDMLAFGTYHVVFANPPYITVKDKAEGDAYRGLYASCYREYSLSVPFAERIFKLAIRGSLEGFGAGYTGQITANSFMKREFGKKLIQEFFPQVDLTHVIDTSGAYVPGHGTPTVVLFGRWRYPRPNSTIRAVLGIRGEPNQPADPAKGLVWQALITQVDTPGSESEWVSVADVTRDQFAKHPWSLSGGGAAEVMEALSHHARATVGDRVRLIGRTAHTGFDETYFAPSGTWKRHGISPDRIVSLVEGDVVRNWALSAATEAIFPYDAKYLADFTDPGSARRLWEHRVYLRERREPGGTHEEIGLTWYEWSRWHPERFQIPLGIAFAFVATHNHFVLDRGGKVFNRSAPVIKLPEGASEDDHLALLGVLNSSTACFWLKQVSHDKGNRGGERSTARYAWESFYEFTGTKLEQFPLPAGLPLELGRELDRLARELAAVEPSVVSADSPPTRERLDSAKAEHERLWGRMIALQEELDWDVYQRYGLQDAAESAERIAQPGSVPEVKLGERAFEIAMARRGNVGEGETQWFARHRSTPVTEIPAHWPEDYRNVVAKRIERIECNRNVGLIERPECKRRWQSEPWEDKEREALTNWLLDQCEEQSLWFGPDGQPRAMTVNRLADRLRADADVVSVARLLVGPDADLADVLRDIIADEHVPYLAQLRYNGEGLLKRALWERTWDLQREEDRTGKRLDIPVPPKYTHADFLKNSYWRQRGKLDVPKERFISYPMARPDSDNSLLLGWAGWDHREQAQVLITAIEERSTTDGWESDRLKPLLAGLSEAMPWVRQWHAEVDERFGASPAEAYDAYLTAKCESCNFSEDDLRNWKPPTSSRGRH
ncbi:MAG TPA: BREX-2 system adenine-specific DNA-methyltransferase PglX [Streptosporangiaceae bacterium]|nr:BREX-2 system adenine-specific DNA-methyltransferase PglX [Streptosporangiaceae bacterium]